MDRIDLQELLQNPAEVVARVRPGRAIAVTDHGDTILRMLPEASSASSLQELVAEGRAEPPTRHGSPELVPGLSPGVESLSALIIADRDRERHR